MDLLTIREYIKSHISLYFIDNKWRKDFIDQIERVCVAAFNAGRQTERNASKHQKFTKFERAELKNIPTPEEMSKKLKISIAESRYQIERLKTDEIWVNNLYQVNISYPTEETFHLSIKRRDKKSIHDWRHLQWIKTLLIGAENEAVEIYPAESRLIDGANQYHLWGYRDPAKRIPFGYHDGRSVNYESVKALGGDQRPEMRIDE